MSDIEHIKTARLLIRPFAESDGDDFFEMMNSPEVCRYIPDEVPTRAQSDEKLTKLIADSPDMGLNDKGRLNLAVELVSQNKMIGWVGLGPLPFRLEETEIYYTFARDYWGKGYAGEAAGAFLGYGFEVLGLEKIVAIVIPENTASVRVIEKLGMQSGGTITGLAEEFVFFEGVLYFSLSRSFWDKAYR